jgi:hypothetical protein
MDLEWISTSEVVYYFRKSAGFYFSYSHNQILTHLETDFDVSVTGILPICMGEFKFQNLTWCRRI